MSSHYIDTSALMNLVLGEAFEQHVKEQLQSINEDGGRIVSSQILDLEVRRTLVSVNAGIPSADVNARLATITRYDLTSADWQSAYGYTMPIKTLDALHIAVAQRFQVDGFITCDKQQARAADAIGLSVLWCRPGTY